MKYKKCHEASDRAAAGTPHLRLLAHAPAAERDAKLRLPEPSQLSRAWELDIVPDPAAAFEGMEDVVVSLRFNTRAELPRRMRAEIKDHGWDVAGPTAYPTLTVLNAPGGGLRERYFEDVIAALESVPRFVAEHAEVLAGRQSAEDHCDWRDPESGTTCSLLPTWEPYAEFASPGVLQPAGPTGPGATPLAALDEQKARGSVNRTLARFRAWLRKPRRGKPPSDAHVPLRLVSAQGPRDEGGRATVIGRRQRRRPAGSDRTAPRSP